MEHQKYTPHGRISETDDVCCRMTTLASKRLSDVTTAAQVSSAELSSASTEKGRDTTNPFGGCRNNPIRRNPDRITIHFIRMYPVGSGCHSVWHESVRGLFEHSLDSD